MGALPADRNGPMIGEFDGGGRGGALEVGRKFRDGLLWWFGTGGRASFRGLFLRRREREVGNNEDFLFVTMFKLGAFFTCSNCGPELLTARGATCAV